VCFIASSAASCSIFLEYCHTFWSPEFTKEELAFLISTFFAHSRIIVIFPMLKIFSNKVRKSVHICQDTWTSHHFLLPQIQIMLEYSSWIFSNHCGVWIISWIHADLFPTAYFYLLSLPDTFIILLEVFIFTDSDSPSLQRRKCLSWPGPFLRIIVPHPEYFEVPSPSGDFLTGCLFFNQCHSW
jgi:hypothetical protein